MPKINIAFSSFSTDEMEKTKKFYGEVLGIKNEYDEKMGVLNLNISGSNIMIYPKKNHTPATFTVLNFIVEDIDAARDELVSKGIEFESYDLPGLKTDERNISRQGEERAMAWFKDPAGNILSILQK